MPARPAKAPIIRLDTKVTQEKCEALIAKAHTLDPTAPLELWLATNYADAPFLASWVAIAAGTLLRRVPNAHVVVAGATPTETSFLSDFYQTPHGLVAATMARATLDQERNRLPLAEQLNSTLLESGGILTKSRSYTLAETGQDRANVLLELSKESGDVARAFTKVLSEIRQEIEINWTASDQNRELDEFIGELYDNAHRHGRLGEALMERMLRQIRFVHARKLISPNRDMLLQRAAQAGPEVLEHFEARARGKITTHLEVSISDFGPGILDHFLASSMGKGLSADQTAIFETLLFKGLTSRPMDSEAGQGIPSALKAARALGAFVAVRTGSFHYTRSFAGQANDHRLKALPGERAKVSGTHWQLLLSTSK